MAPSGGGGGRGARHRWRRAAAHRMDGCWQESGVGALDGSSLPGRDCDRLAAACVPPPPPNAAGSTCRRPVHCRLLIGLLVLCTANTGHSDTSGSALQPSPAGNSAPLRQPRAVRGQLESDYFEDQQAPLSIAPVIIGTSRRQLFGGLRIGEPASTGTNPEDVIAFLGIRYASAPVKRLRFMPPTPFNYAPNQLHDARRFGHICMQRLPAGINRDQAELLAGRLGAPASSNKWAPDAGARDHAKRLRDLQLELMGALLPEVGGRRARLRRLLELEQSEDCLNLNIYAPLEAVRDRLVQPEVGRARANWEAPRNDESLRPVLVVIHGDSFDYGAGASVAGARRFAHQNRLLVVTFNFRLNLLGFPPKVPNAAGPQVGSNLGLLDQVALLHWLQANIRSFGGSPRNVTLLGVKRGAVFVNLLMLSPLARGLFQRAIMEDGTALSPLVASAAVAQQAGGQQQQQQQQVAFQHLRLLALLADCPAGQLGGAANSTALALATQLECLRSKPAEKLVQAAPLALLDPLASSSGEALVLARRWLRPLEALLQRLLELGPELVPADARQQLSEIANRLLGREDQPQAASLSPAQLNQLAAHLVATKHALGRPGNSAAGVELKTVELLDELLGAIYLPSNETLLAPPFAPQPETGTILPAPLEPQADLMAAMLQRHSPFGAHDLLIGTTEPLLEFEGAGGGGEQTGNQSSQLPADSPSDARRRPPSDLIPPIERFGRGAQLELGLSDEQALQQVALFVRTLFRYHQQEIANSIVNNYFLNANNANNNDDGQLAPLITAANQSGSARSSQPASGAPELQRTKQLQLLRSLIGALHDSLLSVPLLKTALVHSLKQLESLAELFTSDQLFRLGQRRAAARQTAEGTGELAKFLHDFERQRLAGLEQEFVQFARSLLEQPDAWPLRLADGGRNEPDESLSRPRATFLYQFDGLADQLVARARAAVWRLEARLKASSGGDRTRALAELRENLVENLLKRMLAGEHQLGRQFGLACGLLGEQPLERADRLLGQVQTLVCDKLGSETLARFVASGNVSPAEGEPPAWIEGGATVDELMSRYELECLARPAADTTNATGNNQRVDHDSVQLEPGSALEAALQSPPAELADCRAQLDQLTLSYLFAGDAEDEQNKSERNKWPTFNVFGQHFASFGRPRAAAAPWSLASFATSERQNLRRRARDKFERTVAFWANFIPTLNCSRTQPISAQSLGLAQTENATLLNMNLNFNCQSGGSSMARTAGALLQATSSKVRADVSSFISALLRQQQQQHEAAAVPSVQMTQSHHSLRMASGREPAQPDELASESPGNRQLVNSSLASWLTVDQQHQQLAGPNKTSLLGPAIWGQRTLAGLWLVAATVLVASTLLTSGCVLAKRRRQKRRHSSSQHKQPPPALGIPPNPPNLNEADHSMLRQTDHQIAHQQLGCPNGLQQHQEAHLQASSDHSSSPASLLQVRRLDYQQPQQHLQHMQIQLQANEAPECANESSEILLNHAATSFIQCEPDGSEALRTPSSSHEQEERPQTLLPIVSSSGHYLGARHHGHLAGCNLLQEERNVGCERQQQQQVLSSSSETTSANQRAHSSVSLVSSSTNTTTITNGLATAARSGNSKKRVKISDPKRRPEQSNTEVLEQATQFYLDEAGTLLTSLDLPADGQQQQLATFCPIHRAGSSSYLMASQGPALFDPNQAAATMLRPRQRHHLELANGGVLQQQRIATVGSLSEYLNLAPRDQVDHYDAGASMGSPNNSLAKQSYARTYDQSFGAPTQFVQHATLDKRHRARQNGSGLCQVHGGKGGEVNGSLGSS